MGHGRGPRRPAGSPAPFAGAGPRGPGAREGRNDQIHIHVPSVSLSAPGACNLISLLFGK